jgi:mercuric ion transport protein
VSRGVRRLLPSGLGGLTALACVLCCVVPILLAAGVLSGVGWAVAGRVLPGVAVALAAATGLAWWLSRRRVHQPDCPGGSCSCP